MVVFFLFLFIYLFFRQFFKHDFFFHFYVKRSRNFDRYVTIRNHDRSRKFKSATLIDRRESLKTKNLHETLQTRSIRENDSKIEI